METRREAALLNFRWISFYSNELKKKKEKKRETERRENYTIAVFKKENKLNEKREGERETKRSEN